MAWQGRMQYPVSVVRNGGTLARYTGHAAQMTTQLLYQGKVITRTGNGSGQSRAGNVRRVALVGNNCFVMSCLGCRRCKSV